MRAMGILVLGAKLVKSNAEMRTQSQHQELSEYQNIRTGRGLVEKRRPQAHGILDRAGEVNLVV